MGTKPREAPDDGPIQTKFFSGSLEFPEVSVDIHIYI